MFDFISASFCVCIVRERTFRCPNCDACACNASPRQRSQFAQTAPPALRQRGEQERRDGIERLESLRTSDVPRPFAIIVDDDPLMLSVAKHSLEEIGYAALTLSSPEEALAVANAIVPDLLLTDALMPRMDGRELCRRLKSQEQTKGVKIVVMSGLYRGVVYRNQAFKEFAVDGFLAKPLIPAVLVSTIDHLLPYARTRVLAARGHAAAGVARP